MYLLQIVDEGRKFAIYQRIAQHRRFAVGSTSLADVHMVKKANDCTVNDVVLAYCGGMLRNWPAERDELPEHPLIAMVPVSVRTEATRNSGGNQVSGMAAVLYTDEPDPVARLQKIHASRSDQKIVQAALPVHAQLDLLSAHAGGGWSRRCEIRAAEAELLERSTTSRARATA